MTTAELMKSHNIVSRLWTADINTTDYRGQKEAIAEATDRMIERYKAGDYQGFLERAKEVNRMFKGLREPVKDQERWEIGGDK